MAIKVNDSTTILNPGTGGDVIDESLVTQSDGVTTAKRQRVAIGGDSGSLQTFTSLGSDTAADVLDSGANELLMQNTLELKRLKNLMRVFLSMSTGKTLDDEFLDEMEK